MLGNSRQTRLKNSYKLSRSHVLKYQSAIGKNKGSICINNRPGTKKQKYDEGNCSHLPFKIITSL